MPPAAAGTWIGPGAGWSQDGSVPWPKRPGAESQRCKPKPDDVWDQRIIGPRQDLSLPKDHWNQRIIGLQEFTLRIRTAPTTELEGDLKVPQV